MYFSRNKVTGIVETFDDNGNKTGEIVTMEDLIRKEEESDLNDSKRERSSQEPVQG